MQSFLELLEEKKTADELIQIAKILNNSYSPIMRDFEVWSMLESLLTKKVCAKYRKNTIGHNVVNDIVFKYYPCERVIKYHLAKQRLEVKNEVTIFEMPINNSRLDVGRINGSSHVFEIKTQYDSLLKLEKQIDDYSKAFEYVNVVIDEKHLGKCQEMLPDYCGILVYGNDLLFKEVNKSSISPNMCSDIQLSTLSSQDLANMLKEFGIRNSPATKSARLELVKNSCSEEQINCLFKNILKNKFSNKWSYLREKFDDILPVDIQSFYQTGADPYWIYYKEAKANYSKLKPIKA